MVTECEDVFVRHGFVFARPSIEGVAFPQRILDMGNGTADDNFSLCLVRFVVNDVVDAVAMPVSLELRCLAFVGDGDDRTDVLFVFSLRFLFDGIVCYLNLHSIVIDGRHGQAVEVEAFSLQIFLLVRKREDGDAL